MLMTQQNKTNKYWHAQERDLVYSKDQVTRQAARTMPPTLSGPLLALKELNSRNVFEVPSPNNPVRLNGRPPDRPSSLIDIYV